jgi:penicillin amidase
MVVELAPTIRGWGIYPGGQSGNPASVRYREHIAPWVAGELEPLIVPASASALTRAQTSATLTLQPAKRR